MSKEFNNIPKVASAVEKAIETALTAAAIKVHGDAALLCPVDTGNLRGSISYSVSGKAVEGLGPPATSSDAVHVAPKDTAIIGTNVEYGAKVEFGSSRHSGKPFLQPALENNTKEITEIMKNIIKKAIDDAARS